MGFERKRFPDHIREQILPDDEKIFDKCKSCPIKEECGGHAEFLMEDDSRYCDRECWKCRAVCCKLDDIYDLLDEFGGVKFDSVNFKFWQKNWPDFIWTIDEDIKKLDDDWYAIPFDSLYNLGYGTWNKDKSQKQRLGLGRDSKLTVSFCMGDEVLDNFKKAEEIEEVANKISHYDFDFSLPINFSVYKNYPRVDQLLNMKRRLYSMEKFQNNGLFSMPDLTLMTERDKNRWIDWANDQRISCAMINFQTKKSELEDNYMSTLDKLESFDNQLEFDCHYFVAGVGPKWIQPILNNFKEVTFINSSAWKNASFKQSIYKNGLKEKDYSKLEIFKNNKKIMRGLYKFNEPNLTEQEKNDFGVN